MDNKLLEILDNILITIESLDARLYNSLSRKALEMVIDIAYNVVKNDKLPDEHLVYGIALMTLDMISKEQVTNITSKKIKDVAITLGSGYNASKWKLWYDMLLNGDADGVYALRYVGVG